MKTKILIIILALLFAGAVVFNGGCGEKMWTQNYYYYPDWTHDGRIICIKEERTYQEVTFPSGIHTSSKYYIATMSEDGTQEANIKEINKKGAVVASPMGNYIAYTEDNYIKIITPQGTMISSVDCENEIDTLDWDPNEKKVVYGTSKSVYVDGFFQYITYEISSTTLIGTEKTTIQSNAWDVSWKYGEKIVFAETIGLVIVDRQNYSSREVFNLAIGNMPAKSKEENVLYFKDGETTLKKLVTINSSNEPEIISSNFPYWYPEISPNGKNIVAGANGQDNSGIWVANIDATNIRQIK